MVLPQLPLFLPLMYNTIPCKYPNYIIDTVLVITNTNIHETIRLLLPLVYDIIPCKYPIYIIDTVLVITYTNIHEKIRHRKFQTEREELDYLSVQQVTAIHHEE